jgi:hypothetical protein
MLIEKINMKELNEKERRVIFEMRQVHFGALLIMIKDNEPVNIERKVQIKLD